jgi:hypothetical protein
MAKTLPAAYIQQIILKERPSVAIGYFLQHKYVTYRILPGE